MKDEEDIASRAILRTLRPLRANPGHQRGHLPAPSADPDDEGRRQCGAAFPQVRLADIWCGDFVRQEKARATK
jgi:hypothetical protein